MKKRNSRKTAVIAMGVVTALTMTACSMIPSAKASYISMDAAQRKALNAANVDAANVESYSAQMGDVGTTTCYEVQFVSDGYTYYYAVNATDGEIVKVTKTPVGEEPIQAQPEQTTDASASQTGEATLPASGDQPVVTQPAETTPSTATGNQNNTATTKPTAGQTTTTPAANGQITLEQAKETALKHAGLKADAVTFVKAEQDYENGKLVYEVEFVTNDGDKVVEYDYEIDAATGSVVSYDYDAENYVSAKGATTVSVDEATAKQTVLNKVPGATAANIYEWKLDFDDGRWEYDGKIVYNLMDNGIRYNVEGGTVLAKLAQTPGQVQILVQDTGIGIPEACRSRVFERFFRVDKSHSKATGGTGLGLSIVRHAAQYHGARLELKSQPGKGTTITVTF